MECPWEHLASCLWRQSWQVVLVIFVVALLCWLLRHRSAHCRYLLWLIVLIKLVTPAPRTLSLPILPIQESIIQTAVAMPQIGGPTTCGRVNTASGPMPGAAAVASAGDTDRKLTRTQQVLIIWATGVAVLGLVCAAKAIRWALWLSQRKRTLPKSTLTSAQGLLSRMQHRRMPKLWIVDEATQPFVWGLCRGSIYLPGSFAGIEHKQYADAILAHELSHVWRYDATVNLVQILLQILFWFHPLVWWVNSRIRVEREKCCDEMAIALLKTGARDYSQALINTLVAAGRVRMPLPALAVTASIKRIEERINTVMNATSYRAKPSLTTAITVFLVACTLVPTGFALTRQISPESSGVLPLLDDLAHDPNALKRAVFVEPSILKIPADSNKVAAFLTQEKIKPLWPKLRRGAFSPAEPGGAFIGLAIAYLSLEQVDRFLGMAKLIDGTKVLASPEMMASDGQKMTIKSTEYHVYELIDTQTDPPKKKPRSVEGGVTATVIPHFKDNDVFHMTIDLEMSTFLLPDKRTASDLPIVTRRKIRNTVAAKMGQGVLLRSPSHAGAAYYLVVQIRQAKPKK